MTYAKTAQQALVGHRPTIQTSVIRRSDKIMSIPEEDFVLVAAAVTVDDELLHLFYNGKLSGEDFHEHVYDGWCGWSVPNLEVAALLHSIVARVTDNTYRVRSRRAVEHNRDPF